MNCPNVQECICPKVSCPNQRYIAPKCGEKMTIEIKDGKITIQKTIAEKA